LPRICSEGKYPTLTFSYYWTCKNEHIATKYVINLIINLFLLSNIHLSVGYLPSEQIRGKYPYLPSYIRICPLIQLPVYAQWYQRLYVKVQGKMVHKDMHKIVGCHDIAEILLKVALNTTNQIKSSIYFYIAKKIFELTNCENKSLRELPLLPVYAQWYQRLYVKVQGKMVHKDMHKIVFQSN
jgi:hypothetical protein